MMMQKEVESRIDSSRSFARNYGEARSKFLEAVTEHGGRHSSFNHPKPGPDGASLSTDVALFGAEGASRLLVMVSGTHGVEGFCGSGAQVDLLRRGEVRRLPPAVGIIMVHAINPYGFAWLRRTTEENVDLNRNWIDFDAPVPENAGYRSIAHSLCPTTWNAKTRSVGREVLRKIAETQGLAAAKHALAGGQYEFADGLYYGGAAPTWSRQTLTTILTRYAGHAARVAILDYHTGIGPWGFGELIMTVGPDSEAFRRAQRWFGNGVRSTLDGSSVAARIGGDAMSASHHLLPAAQVTPLVLEVGTLARQTVIDANRADNWLYAHGDPSAPYASGIKRNIRAAYYGDRADWKGMVAGQSLVLCRQAIAGLAE